MRGIENQHEFMDPLEWDLSPDQFRGGPGPINVGVRVANISVLILFILGTFLYLIISITDPGMINPGSAMAYFSILTGALILFYPLIVLLATLRSLAYSIFDHLDVDIAVRPDGLLISYPSSKGWLKPTMANVLIGWEDIRNARFVSEHPEVSLLDLWVRAFVPARAFQKKGTNYSPFVPVFNIVVIDLAGEMRIRRFRSREKKDGSFDTELTKMVLVEIRRKDRRRFMELVNDHLRPGT